MQSCGLHNLEYAPQRNPHPVRPAVELVSEFVQRLLEDHRRQLETEVVGRLRQERGIAGGVEVAPEESRGNRVDPEPSPRTQARPGVRQELPGLERCLAGVVERPQHSSDVAEGEALEAALIEGARRLALEVDDHEVMAGVKDLAKVI